MSTRRKRTYAVLIALGLVAVVIDRMVGYSTTRVPSLAQAGSGSGAARPTGSEMVPDSPRVEAARFPRDLPLRAEVPATRDPFVPPMGLFPLPTGSDGTPVIHPAGRPGPPGDPPDPDPPAPREAFANTHRLAAVIADERDGIVLLDGQLLAVGQSVDECVLASVSADSATFTCSDGPITLSVETRTGIQD